MPKTINPIRKHLLKQNLLKGKSIRQSLKDTGYSQATSHSNANMTTNRCVKACMDEIQKDFNLSSITPEYVLKHINDIMLDPKANHSDKLRANELLGKFLKLWVDRQEVDNKHPDKVIISYVKDTNNDKKLDNIGDNLSTKVSKNTGC